MKNTGKIHILGKVGLNSIACTTKVDQQFRQFGANFRAFRDIFGDVFDGFLLLGVTLELLGHIMWDKSQKNPEK